jgi:hypothetical protein
MRELEREKTQLVRMVADLDRRLKDATALVVPAGMRTGYPGLRLGAPSVRRLRSHKAYYGLGSIPCGRARVSLSRAAMAARDRVGRVRLPK